MSAPVDMVYVITADAEYETRTPILVFETKVGAVGFIMAVNEYAKTVKFSPVGDGTAESDREYEKWERWKKRWDKKHPAGPHWASYLDNFSVTPVPLRKGATS